MGLKTKKFFTLASVVRKFILVFLATLLFLTSINVSVFASNDMDNLFKEIKKENVTKQINEETNPSNIPISFEDTSKRDAYTKHFRKLDGSYEVSVYNEAVHYMKENKWKQIDNRLTLNEQTNEYENKENSYKFKLPKKIHENKAFKLQYENYKIDWTIKDINKTDITVTQNESINSNNLRVVENVNQRVIYEGIQDNVNLELILTGSKIKENIILDQYIDNYSLTYHFILKDLELKEQDGQVVFVNELDEVIFSLGSFYMFDNNLKESSNIEIEINEIKKDEYELKIIPDNEWLQSDERAYPVTIDPTIIIASNGSSPLKDKYTIKAPYSDASFDDAMLMVGSIYNQNTGYIKYKSYIEVNLNEVVSKPVITYANLQLDVYDGDNYCDNDCQINVKEVISGKTFDSINGSSTSITNPEIVDYVKVNNNYPNTIPNYPETTYLWDITKLVQKWKYNNQSYGILELSNNIVNGKHVSFDSSEYTSGVKPQIIIGYVEQTGLNDYWTYHSQSAGKAGIGYVNDYTGNLTFIHGDYTPLGEAFSFGISHVYNVDYKHDNIGYGKGWRLNLNGLMYFDEDAQQYYYQDGDGSKTYFYHLPCDDSSVYSWNTCYIAEDGSQQAFDQTTYDFNNFNYSMKTPDGIEMSYNLNRSINLKYVKYTDLKSKNTFTVSYIGVSDKIEKVTDSQGNRVDFIYYNETDNQNLNTIQIKRKDENGVLAVYKEIQFTYQNDYLTNITHFYVDSESGELVSEDTNVFGYDNSNRLNDVKNTFNNGLHYEYASSSRDQVSKVELYANVNGVKEYISRVKIDYQFKQTRFTNESDDEVVYTFDNYGHTINVVDDKGNAQFYEYYDLFNNLPENPVLVNWNLNHKLIHVSNPQKNHFSDFNTNYTDDRQNLLNNPSFETDTTGWSSNGVTQSNRLDLGIYDNILGNKSIQVVGDGDLTKYIEQTINVNGSSGDNLVFGGWAYGYTQPHNYQSEKHYRISLTLNEYYYDTTLEYQCIHDPVTFAIVCDYYPVETKVYEPKTHYLNFNSDIEIWQYLMNEISATNNYDQITFKIEYRGEGTVQFDGLQLYQEEFGTGYSYIGEDNPSDQTKSGNLKSVDYPGMENNVVYSYNDDNDVSQIIEPDGTVVDVTHTSNREVDTVVKNNVKIDFDYDTVKGDIVTTGDIGDLFFTTSTTYAFNKQFINTSIDPYGTRINYNYDPVTGLLESLTYENIDNSNSVMTDYQYDAYGRLKGVTKDSSLNTYVYEEGKLKKIEVNGFYYEFIYDDFNRIQEVKVNNETLMTYDYAQKSQDGIVYHQNQIQNQNYANQDKIRFEYDDEDRISDIYFNEVKRFHYEYDYAGRLSTYHDLYNGSTFTYAYSLNGRLKSITDQDNNVISFGYNNNGQQSDYDYTINGSSTKVDYHYYTYGAFEGMYDMTTFNVDGKMITKNYQYDNDSLKRLNSIALSINGSSIINQTLGYDDSIKYDDNQNIIGNASTRVKTISYDINGLSYQYTYDYLGNITDIIVSENGIKAEEYHYEYDDLNQLIREDVNVEGLENDFTKVFEYDNHGNILSIKQYSYQHKTTIENLTGTPVATNYGYTNAWKDQLTQYNNTSIHYDQSGNPDYIGPVDKERFNFDGVDSISSATIEMELHWDGRQLNNIEVYGDKASTSFTYFYNAQGIRTKKVIDGVTTEYYLDGDKVLKETKSVGIEITYFYDIDNTLTGFSYNNNIYLYIRNLQGDITKIVDETGNVMVEYTYDAWGDIINTVDNTGTLNLSEINPYRYRGYRFDEETGWFYLNSRYYNPEIGRFINADGLIGEVGSILGHNMCAPR